MAGTRTIHVFIASPGDLAVERRAFKDVVDELNSGFGDGAGVKFVPLGWEDTLATTGRRSQGVINKEIDRCDVFVLALHRRWGQEAPDAEPYTSYTEEEFHRALDRWKKTGAPEIFVFFKYVDAASMGDPGEQLKKVLAFRKSLEESRKVLHHFFNDEKEFGSEVDKHLRAYAKDEIPKADDKRDVVILPLEYVEEVKKAREEAERQRKLADAAVNRLRSRKRPRRKGKAAEQQKSQREAVGKLAVARAEELALLLAEQAAKAAVDGRVEEARQLFAKAQIGTTQLRVLYLAYEFYQRTGDLSATEQMMERSLAISGRDAQTADTAASLSNLGAIYWTRGDLDRAEAVVKKSLAIYEKLSHQEGMANDYGNLGLIFKKRGYLDQAEEMLKKSLATHEKLGRQGGISTDYTNLGLIYTIQGDLERAEEMHKKALAIDEKLGDKEGMAVQYGSLGVIYQTRGDLNQAEEMLKKALAIDEKLGHQEGMAIRYGNLGLICRRRGDLDQAEEMLKKALAIDEKFGLQEGMAADYGNLGSIAKDRRNFESAREFWSKARELYAKIGIPNEVQKIEGWLDSLPKGN
jgi:tetratricopeptide (TPR) repeat protein